MSRTLLITFALVLCAAGGCASSDSSAVDSSRRAYEDIALGAAATSRSDADEMVTFDQCPAAVQHTIESHLDGGTITELERTTDHGEVLYEVDVKTADGVFEFDVAADGAFRGYEGEDDDEDGDDDDGDDDEDGGEG